MRALVTGGAGFIGSHLVEHLQDNVDVRVIDNLRTGCRDNLVGFRCEFIEGDISDRETVRRAVLGVDYVFHLAAMISVPESVEKPIECNKINTEGTLILLEEAAKAGVKKFVLSSSAAIYGDNPAIPKLETMAPEPKSPYAITKLVGEYYCQMFTSEGRLPTACLRYFNVFGPRQNPRSQYAAAVPIFIDQALRNEPIIIHGNGEQTRDFIDVKDVVKANAFMAMKTPATGVFNVAYGQATSINQLANLICKLTGSQSKIKYAPGRSGDVKHSLGSIAKLRAAGFEPAGQVNTNLETTVEYYKQTFARAR